MLYNSQFTYKAPFYLPGAHIQTCYPSLFRRVTIPEFERRQIPTPDTDTLNIDLAKAPSSSRSTQLNEKLPPLVILSHGLEGNSRRKYICGMANIFLQYGFDALAWNFRFCGSEEPNKTTRLYHSGDTDDLHTVVEYAVELGYKHIVLIGFSMGGNQILKYLGEGKKVIPCAVMGAVVFSTPCDLVGCSVTLAQKQNRIYMINFLQTLRSKVRAKHAFMPDAYPIEGLEKIKTFKDFDDRYTAPLHGFNSAEDYWRKSSSLQFLEGINKEVLLVNAGNDPFLSASCFPEKQAANSKMLHYITPKEGGHVGFTTPGKVYWSEQIAFDFVKNTLGITGC